MDKKEWSASNLATLEGMRRVSRGTGNPGSEIIQQKNFTDGLKKRGKGERKSQLSNRITRGALSMDNN